MLFLTASLAQRKRKILLEEILLLATRALIFALAVITFARPYSKSNESAIWMLTGACAIAAIILMVATAVMWYDKSARKRLLIAASALTVFVVATSFYDGIRSYMATNQRGAKDIAIIIDASSSMNIKDENGVTVFEKAKEEVDKFIESSERNTSFAIILGGSNPKALTASPISDRKKLFNAIDEIQPLEGTFHATDAIALAATILDLGANANKQIIVFGDGQSVGWETEKESSWDYINDLLSEFPTKPRIIWKQLGVPEQLRNLTISRIDFSREIFGIDREVGIDVTVVNNSSEAVTAKSIILAVEGRTYTDEALGQIQPGESRIASFRHKFSSAGTHPIRAILEVDDDLTYDNVLTKIAPVRKSVDILVVEATGAARLSERTGAFIALSLTPTSATINKEKTTTTKAQPTPDLSSKYFTSSKLITAKEFNTLTDIDKYACIIIADLPRLPKDIADRLEEYTKLGGNLMLITAKRADSDFYNNWQGKDQIKIMPLIIGDETHNDTALTIDPATIKSPAIKNLAQNGDLSTAIFEECRKITGQNSEEIDIYARFTTGTPLYALQKYGKGQVMQFTAALDPSSGNLISRQSFLPMIHELVHTLTEPIKPQLNHEPSIGGVITLGSNPFISTNTAKANGLRGVYHQNDKEGKLLKITLDPQISFNWRHSSIDNTLAPDENIHIEWTGSLIVPETSSYKIRTHSSGITTISFPGEKKYFGLRRSTLNVDLLKGSHDIVVTYNGSNKKDAYIELYWQPKNKGESQIPSSALSPIQSGAKDRSEDYEVAVENSKGQEIPATLRLNQETTTLHITDRLDSGVYTAMIPSVLIPKLKDFATTSNTFSRINFSIGIDAGESILAMPTQDEIAIISKKTDFVTVTDQEEFERAVYGAVVGKELWRRAAIPLFILLIAEVFLSRWITAQRRIGEENTVTFAEGDAPSSAFTEILNKMKGMR